MILVKIYDYSLSTLAVLQALTNSDDKTMVTATTATFLYDFFLQKDRESEACSFRKMCKFQKK
jgi:hypothetical protein